MEKGHQKKFALGLRSARRVAARGSGGSRETTVLRWRECNSDDCNFTFVRGIAITAGRLYANMLLVVPRGAFP